MIIEPTCAIARWAHMHRFPSVLRLSLDQHSDQGWHIGYRLYRFSRYIGFFKNIGYWYRLN